MKTVGFIGTGEIASHMVIGLGESETRILVSPRNADIAAKLSETYAHVSIASLEEIVEQSDVVFLCLMAGVAREILPTLTFKPNQTVISAMVDVPLEDLQGLCAPATDIAITIPLPSISTAGCPLPVYPANAVLEELYGENNTILPQPSEEALNAHFIASAMLSVVFDQYQQAADWLVKYTGDEKSATAYFVGLFAGQLASFSDETDLKFADVLQSLSTEGGLNATLRQHMRDAGAVEALGEGLKALGPRMNLS